MNKFYSVLAGGLLSALALGALPAAGQTQPVPLQRCSTEEVNARIQAELKRTIPGYNPERKVAITPTRSTGRTGAITYTLPVIVHVINNGEAVGTLSNISQAQVQSQLDVLNEDYRNLNADGSMVPSVYQPRRGDMQVQFVNALRDPNGNTLAEPGIDRVNRNTKGFTAPPYATTSYIDGTIKPNTYWDPSRYINIWVLDLGGGLLGYAQFPDNTGGLGGLNTLGGSAATDGVVILYGCYGSRIKAPTGSYKYPNVYDRGRTLTHELGHWFGFRHIWGDAACGNDYCADTPTQQKENYGCVTFPQVTCSNVTGDMSMNYMDYSNDPCMYMFTEDQKSRLQTVMLNTPRRTELVNSNVACANVAPATATNSGPACVGSSVTLTATGPAGATYVWTGPNGYTSTAQNPTLTNITAAAAGSYKVTVSVTTGACAGVATTTVAVNPTPPVPTLTAPSSTCPGTPVTLSASGLTPTGTLPNENFNASAPNWTIANAGAPATTWQYTPGNTLSIPGLVTNFTFDNTRFAFSNSDAGGQGSLTNTTLTSPSFSTVGYSALSVSFQQVTIIDSGYGAVEVSTNGGTTWTPVYTNYGNITTIATTSVNLAGYLNQPNVRLRWHYVDAWGYVWFIDNVQFTATVPTLTYTWTLVSGNGLPTVTNTPTITATPTQNSVYRLTVGYVGSSCTSSATVAVNFLPTTWTGATGDGNWFTAGNWQNNCVPTRYSDAIIPANLTTKYPTIATGTAEVRSLVQQGALTMTGGELDLYGDHTGTGDLNLSGGIVATRGTVAQALRGASYQTLIGGGTGTKTIPTSTVNVALNMTGAILNTGSSTVTLASAATITETDATYVLGQVTITHLVLTATDNFGGIGVSFTPNTPAGNTTILRTTGQPLGTGTGMSISRYYDITPLVNRTLQGANLALSYFPHELNGLTESQLVLFHQTAASTNWSNEGATLRDATNKVVSRNYVTSSTGRWTLATSLPTDAVTYAVTAFPVPFTADGLGIQITTDTGGPLEVKMYDMVGRTIYNSSIDVTPGTSNIMLPGSNTLQGGQYIVNVKQNGKETRLRVARF